MANPSKRYPWIVQMHASAIGAWLNVSAYRTEAEAEAQADFARKQAPGAEWRVVQK